MQLLRLPGSRLTWLSPLIGALGPAIYFSARSFLTGDSSDIVSAFAVWFLRDLVLGYGMALPALAILWRLGARHLGLLWAAVALVGAPMGYVLANPVQFAWTPTEAQFEHGPYWMDMFVYMALFGLSALAYGYSKQPRSKHVA